MSATEEADAEPLEADAEPEAVLEEGKKKKDKGKAKDKGKKKKGEPEDEAPRTFAAAEDARAMAGIKRAKGLGGLAGFAVTAFASYMHGELIVSLLLRSLAGGLVGYLVAWLAAVTVWRRIIRAELQHGFEVAMAARQTAQVTAQQADVQ